MRLRGSKKVQRLVSTALIMATTFLFLSDKQPGMAQQQERPKIALLIGNGAYTGAISKLKNPLRDIETIKKALLKTGFQERNIIMVRNGGFRTIHKTVGRYIRRLKRSGRNAIGFFYYSGHGAVNRDTKVNYLIPTDIKVSDTDELWDSSIQLQTIINKLRGRASNATHFVVFDACRNSLKLSRPGTKALFEAKGFEAVRKVRGMLIAYATADGETAADASAYADALAAELVRPGVEAVSMFRKVQLKVARTLGQEPWLTYGALGETYFAGRESPVIDNVKQVWLEVKNSNDPEDLQAFIAQFGKKYQWYGRTAQKRLTALEQQLKQLEPQKRQEPTGLPQTQTPSADGAQPLPSQPQPDPVVKQAQRGLAALNYDPGPADGFMGPRTKLAIEAFQRHEKLGITGMVDSSLLEAMNRARPIKVAVGIYPAQPYSRPSYVPETVLISAGTFSMGCVSGKGCQSDEKPVHKVTVGSFYLAKYETTFAQWDAAQDDKDWHKITGLAPRNPKDRGWGRGKRPVIYVSWDDAVAYAKWLSRKTGQVWRLPTEAEWEYAARAGSEKKYSWGNSVGKNKANCYNCGSQWDNKKTAPVGSFSENPFKAHDMHGNVWEWVHDWKGEYSSSSQTDPRGPKKGSGRVLRGGGWGSDARVLRSANRVNSSPGSRSNSLGFRLLRQPS